MLRSRPLALLLLLLALTAIAAACGGGDDEPESTTITLQSSEPVPTATDAPTTGAATSEAEPTTAASPVTGDSLSPPTSTDEGDVPTTDTTGTDAEPPTSTVAADPAALAVAEQALLTAEDLGAGWVAEVDSSEDSGCLTGPLRQAGPLAETRGEQLTNGQQTAVRSIALVYPDAETAAQAFLLASDFAVIECFVTSLKASGPEGLQVENVAAEPIEWPAAGDEVIAARVTLPVEQGAEAIVATADIVMTRAGRVILAGQFLSAPEPFPQAQAAEVMTTAANRVTGA